jgi:hypothetical protein
MMRVVSKQTVNKYKKKIAMKSLSKVVGGAKIGKQQET